MAKYLGLALEGHRCLRCRCGNTYEQILSIGTIVRDAAAIAAISMSPFSSRLTCQRSMAAKGDDES